MVAPTTVIPGTVGGSRFCGVAGSGEGAAGNLERFQKVLGRFRKGFRRFGTFYGKLKMSTFFVFSSKNDLRDDGSLASIG